MTHTRSDYRRLSRRDKWRVGDRFDYYEDHQFPPGWGTIRDDNRRVGFHCTGNNPIGYRLKRAAKKK
jgi:hypothetical protein